MLDTFLCRVQLNADDLEEYCSMETFRPNCWKNEVILVEEAIYGRRRVGKCISSREANLVQDSQYFGCFANVLHIVGQKCSGRRECTISMPDPDLEQTTPCLEGLKMFLEVRYSCVEGTLIRFNFITGQYFAVLRVKIIVKNIIIIIIFFIPSVVKIPRVKNKS